MSLDTSPVNIIHIQFVEGLQNISPRFVFQTSPWYLLCFSAGNELSPWNPREFYTCQQSFLLISKQKRIHHEPTLGSVEIPCYRNVICMLKVCHAAAASTCTGSTCPLALCLIYLTKMSCDCLTTLCRTNCRMHIAVESSQQSSSPSCWSASCHMQ